MQSGVSIHRRSGFALVEVVVSAVIVTALVAIFTLAAAESRRSASLGESINNLKQFAWAGSAYTGDCNDRFWTFSWNVVEHPPGQQFSSDQAAAAAQAVDIIRRRSYANMASQPSWLPNINYSALVLVDQLNLQLPLPWAVSPSDDLRLIWQQCANDHFPSQCFSLLPLTMRPSGPSGDIVRNIYSSSYMLGPAFFSRDMRSPTQTTLQSALTDHYNYIVGTLPLGDRLVTQIAHPSRKAVIWDTYQRHFGRQRLYYAYPEARLPILIADGAVSVRATAETNPGFVPNIPNSANPLHFNYAPRPFEYPTRGGEAQESVTGYYQWTRGGLAGNDVGAPEVCTGQPGCTP